MAAADPLVGCKARLGGGGWWCEKMCNARTSVGATMCRCFKKTPYLELFFLSFFFFT